MAATIGVPTMSQIQAWDVTHLAEAATHWSSRAWEWEDAFTYVHDQTPYPGGTPWHGVGADAALARTGADKMVVSRLADTLHTAAAVARNGAEDILGARQLALEAIEEARAAGFTVTEELSLTPPPSAGLLHQAQLQTQAQVLAADIRTRAAELLAADTRVAAQIDTAAAGLTDVSFAPHPVTPPSAPKKPTVQAVDNNTIKQDPPPPDPGTDRPWETQPSPRNLDQVQDALRQLRRGQNKPNRELDTAEEIQDFYDWLTKNSTGHAPSAAPFPRERLDDGTILALRPDSRSGGETINVTLPDGKDGPKVHLPLTPPIVSSPPQLPPLASHPPTAPPLPLPSGPAPVVLPPPQATDPASLPPWLQNPALHGTPIPSQLPTIMPGVTLPTTPTPITSPPDPAPALLPQIGHDLAQAGETATAGALIGVAVIAGLLGIGPAGQGATP
jgi:hypothetical protein